MKWFYLAMILAISFTLILSLTTLRLRLQYRRQGRDDRFALDFSIWRGVFYYKLEIPAVELKAEKMKPARKVGRKPLLWPVLRPAFKIRAEVEGKEGRLIAGEEKKFRIPGPAKLMEIITRVIRRFKRYYPLIIYLLGRVHLRRLHWRTELGFEDPSLTGILTGTAWAFKGFILTYIYRLLSPGSVVPAVSVAPCFEKACLDISLDCIFEVKIGYIIFTGFKALVTKYK